MIRYYWIIFCWPVGRGGVKHEERVVNAHPFVAMRQIKLARNDKKIHLLNYKPINKKEYDLFINLNKQDV